MQNKTMKKKISQNRPVTQKVSASTCKKTTKPVPKRDFKKIEKVIAKNFGRAIKELAKT